MSADETNALPCVTVAFFFINGFNCDGAAVFIHEACLCEQVFPMTDIFKTESGENTAD